MLDKIIVNQYNLWVVVFVALGTLATAYGLAIIGSTVGQPNFYAYFNLATSGPGYSYTTNIIGALNGVNSAGAFFGCWVNAWSSERIGRKWSMMLGSAILIVGGALCSGAVHIAMFLVGRFVAGLGTGILACVVPMYQSEVSTAETRGAMVCITGIMYALGYSIAGWLGYACFHMPATDPNAQFAWRFPLAFQVVFPLMLLIGQRFVPYSPRWLLSKGRKEEAYEIVKKLHATKADPNHIHAKEEFYLMEKQYELDARMGPSGIFELFKGRANQKRALMAFVLMWGNQFLGVFILANYGVLIYIALGFTGSVPLLLNACWTTFTLIGNTWTAFYIDKFGRRTFQLIGSIGCLVSTICLTGLYATYVGTDGKAGLRACVFFVFFYIFWWCFFIDATQYVYVSEIFPNHLRSQGVALGISAFYLASEVTLVAAPIGLNKIGWKFFLVVIIPSVFYIAVQYFFFPETKGRTLEEIGALFGDKNIAVQVYDMNEEERHKIQEEATHVVEAELHLVDTHTRGMKAGETSNIENVHSEKV